MRKKRSIEIRTPRSGAKVGVRAVVGQEPVALLASGDRDHILSGVFNQFLSEKSEPAE